MNFEMSLINPKTGEERKMLVELTTGQAAAASTASCLPSFIQSIARTDIPDGFMPIGNGVKAVTLQ